MSDNAVVKATASVPGLQAFRSDLDAMAPQLASMLAGRMDPEHFLEVATTAYLDTPELARCDVVSLVRAVRRAAQLKLRPDGVEGALIPRGGKASFEPMFQGLVRTMLRARTVRKVEARVVKAGDDFDYQYGIDPILVHKPTPSHNRGGTTYAYAIVWLTSGDTQFEVMDREELDKVKRLTKENNRGKLGPSWTHYEDEMFRKTVVKRLAKYIEQDPELAAVIEYDNAIEAGSDRDPADMLPGAEWRTLDQRMEERAAAQVDDIRSRIHRASAEAAEAAPDDEGGERDPKLAFLASTPSSGKYKHLTWREIMNEHRGYITHWVIPQGGDFVTDDQRAWLTELAELTKEEAEPEAEGQAAEGTPSRLEALRAEALEIAKELSARDLWRDFGEREELELLSYEGSEQGLRDWCEEMRRRIALQDGPLGGLWPEGS